MSMGSVSTLAKVEVTEHLELPGTTDGILRLVQMVLARPGIQAIDLRVGYPVAVTWIRGMHDAPLTVQAPPVNVEELLASVPVQDFHAGSSAKEALADVLLHLSSRGRYPAFLIVGSIQHVKDMLNIPSTSTIAPVAGTSMVNIAGIRTLEAPSLPPESAVLFGAVKEWATPEEVLGDPSSVGLRLTMWL